jgi:hypothetical protein
MTTSIAKPMTLNLDDFLLEIKDVDKRLQEMDVLHDSIMNGHDEERAQEFISMFMARDENEETTPNPKYKDMWKCKERLTTAQAQLGAHFWNNVKIYLDEHEKGVEQ